MFTRNRVKYQAFLKTLTFCFLAFLLSSCGGSKENLGPPSIPRELKYEFVDEGIKLTWKSPINNFNYKAKIGQDLSDPEFKEAVISENYFALDKFVSGVAFQKQYVVYQEPDEEIYELVIPIQEVSKFARPDGSLSIYLRAYNEPPTDFREPEGGWTQELRDAGYGAYELQFYRSNAAVVYVKLPFLNSSPQFKGGLVTNDSKANHNDYYTWTTNSWLSAIDYLERVEFCDFIEMSWNRTETIEIETRGSFQSRNVFTLNDYLKGAEQSEEGCLRVRASKANRGALNYKITLSNGAGRTMLTGQYVINKPWPVKGESTKSVPREPYVPERWNNLTPENERAAKTVWCIENGYRDYDLKTNRCIY
jgi:hypothetical protein